VLSQFLCDKVPLVACKRPVGESPSHDGDYPHVSCEKAYAHGENDENEIYPFHLKNVFLFIIVDDGKNEKKQDDDGDSLNDET